MSRAMAERRPCALTFECRQRRYAVSSMPLLQRRRVPRAVRYTRCALLCGAMRRGVRRRRHVAVELRLSSALFDYADAVYYVTILRLHVDYWLPLMRYAAPSYSVMAAIVMMAITLPLSPCRCRHDAALSMSPLDCCRRGAACHLLPPMPPLPMLPLPPFADYDAANSAHAATLLRCRRLRLIATPLMPP